MRPSILFGFHAVTVRLKTAPESIVELHVDAQRLDVAAGDIGASRP